MKKIRNFVLVFTLLLMTLFVSKEVNAFSDTLTITKNGTVYIDDAILGENTSYGKDYAYFTYKYTTDTNNIVFCTGARDDLAGTNFKACNFSGTSTPDKVAAGVAGILREGVGGATGTSKNSLSNANLNAANIYYTQVAIWRYLDNEGVQSNDTSAAMSVLTSKGLDQRVKNLFEYGRSYAVRYLQIQNLTLSYNKAKITFTLDSNGEYYVSNKIKVTPSNADVFSGKVGYEVTSSPSISDIKVTGNYTDGYYIKIPVSSITEKTTISFNVEGNSNVYYMIQNYCPSDGAGQDVTTNIIEPKYRTVSKKISGTIEPTKVTITKKDQNNNNLSGALLAITDEDGEILYEWTSTSSAQTITGLPAGKYYLKELTAPSGYKLAKNVPFEISTDSSVVMKNELTEFKIKKVELSKNKYSLLSGATLEILDSNGNVAKDISGNLLSWTSDTTAKTITGLAAGKYTLVEKQSPNGYGVSVEIPFTLNQDGTITSDNLESKLGILDKNSLTIIMLNSLTNASFSKIDVSTGKELPGATLQILDKDKKPILDKDGKELYKWVSTNEPHIIEGLPVGKYYLKEVIAPEGYALTEELVEFEIKSDGTMTKVVMKNTPKVDVPDTGSARSIILIICGILLSAAGVGIVTYTVIKNKKNSKI